MNLRKPLLFTAVFGVGLTVLWFAREDPSEQAERSPQPVERPRQVPSGDGAEAAVSFGGRLEYTQFAAEEREGRRPKLFRLIAADVKAVQGDVYDVEGLFVELFEPDTQAVRATLRSPRPRMPIRLRAGRQEFGEEDEVTLTAVDAEVFDGLPLVPARFEASALWCSPSIPPDASRTLLVCPWTTNPAAFHWRHRAHCTRPCWTGKPPGMA